MEHPGEENNKRIVEYHSATDGRATTDEVPWCSSFACWVVSRSGIKSPASAWAKSWLNWGIHLPHPTRGCIAVFSRGEESGHVGFFDREEGENIIILGGNQGDRVSLAAYNKARLLGYRGIALLACLMLSACTNKEAPPPAPATGEYKAAWDKKRPEWTPILVAAIKEHGQGLLQSYPEGVCGDRMTFYVALMSKLAEYESSFNPDSEYKEAWNGDDGKPQISAGIFQLSVSDAKYNAGCKFGNMKELKDPKNNIYCAVFIANKWVSKDGKLAAGSDSSNAKGFARYWGPMRKPVKRDAVLAAARATCT